MKDAFPKRFHHHFKDYVPNLASILSTKDWLKSAVQAHEHPQTRTHTDTHTHNCLHVDSVGLQRKTCEKTVRKLCQKQLKSSLENECSHEKSLFFTGFYS